MQKLSLNKIYDKKLINFFPIDIFTVMQHSRS